MAADPPDTDPADQAPRERGLERRSGSPSVIPWVVLAAIGLLAAAAYVIPALL